MKSNNEGLSREERLRRFDAEVEAWARGEDKPRPTPVVTLPVSEKLAAAANANPQSVRVSARGSDGIARVEGPLPNSIVTVCVDRVREVDADGRPIWETGSVEHVYDPFEKI